MAERTQQVETVVMPNIFLRGQIVDFVAELVACPNPPDTVKEALDELQTSVNKGDATSFLSAALALKKQLDDMKGKALKLGCTDGELSVCLNDDEGVKELVGSCDLARTLTDKLCLLKVQRLGGTMLAASTQETIDRFGEHLCVSASVPEFQKTDFTAANMCKAWEASIAKVAMAMYLKVASRIFTTSSAKKVEHPWPTDDYLVLVNRCGPSRLITPEAFQ